MFWSDPMFWWGAFGALLPEIIRSYLVVTGSRSRQANGVRTLGLPKYFAVSAVYAFSGGLFTFAWQPENEFKAIWVGVSFPVLVSAMLARPPDKP